MTDENFVSFTLLGPKLENLVSLAISKTVDIFRWQFYYQYRTFKSIQIISICRFRLFLESIEWI